MSQKTLILEQQYQGNIDLLKYIHSYCCRSCSTDYLYTPTERLTLPLLFRFHNVSVNFQEVLWHRDVVSVLKKSSLNIQKMF